MAKKILLGFIAAFIIGGLLTLPPVNNKEECTNDCIGNCMGLTDPILFHV